MNFKYLEFLSWKNNLKIERTKREKENLCNELKQMQ